MYVMIIGLLVSQRQDSRIVFYLWYKENGLIDSQYINILDIREKEGWDYMVNGFLSYSKWYEALIHCNAFRYIVPDSCVLNALYELVLKDDYRLYLYINFLFKSK